LATAIGTAKQLKRLFLMSSLLYKVKISECVIEVQAISANEACSEALLAIVEDPHQLETEVIEEPDDNNSNEWEIKEADFNHSSSKTTSSYKSLNPQYAGFTYYEAEYSYL
jgi:hypothetical protein